MHGECVAAAVLHLHVDMTNLFYVSPLATFEVERSQRDEPWKKKDFSSIFARLMLMLSSPKQ